MSGFRLLISEEGQLAHAYVAREVNQTLNYVARHIIRMSRSQEEAPQSYDFEGLYSLD
jgi:hypothetical protein